MVRNCLGLVAALAGLLVGQPSASAAEPLPKPTAAEGPVVFLRPTHRDGHVAPGHHCSGLTGGGAATVLQPAPDTLVVTITGAAAAKANPFKPSMAEVEAAVEQQFEVVFPAGPKPARLILEGRILGLFRSEGGKTGRAELAQATAVVHHDSQPLADLTFPPRAVNGKEALAVNLKEGPVCVPVGPGCHGLHLSFHIAASQSRCLCPHISSAEFAPPPALPASWIHVPDPFGGVDRSKLGFQVTLRVEPVPPAGRVTPATMGHVEQIAGNSLKSH
jgi:hypothetical protein